MKRAESQIRREPGWWTVPNLVTGLRFVLVIPIIALILSQEHPLTVAALAGIFATSDWVDGYLARRLGQTGRIGAVLDPLADRAGIACIAIAIAAIGAAPWWTITLFLVVDLIVGTVYLVRRRRLVVTVLGKVRTGVAMAGLFTVMVGLVPGFGALLPVGQAALAIGAVLHIGAGALYLGQMLERGRLC